MTTEPKPRMTIIKNSDAIGIFYYGHSAFCAARNSVFFCWHVTVPCLAPAYCLVAVGSQTVVIRRALARIAIIVVVLYVRATSAKRTFQLAELHTAPEDKTDHCQKDEDAEQEEFMHPPAIPHAAARARAAVLALAPSADIAMFFAFVHKKCVGKNYDL